MSPGDSNVHPSLKSYWLKTVAFKFSMPQTHSAGLIRQSAGLYPLSSQIIAIRRGPIFKLLGNFADYSDPITTLCETWLKTLILFPKVLFITLIWL